MAQRVDGYKLTQIADYFGLSHYGGVAASISQVKRDIKGNSKIKNNINSVVKRFAP